MYYEGEDKSQNVTKHSSRQEEERLTHLSYLLCGKKPAKRIEEDCDTSIDVYPCLGVPSTYISCVE